MTSPRILHVTETLRGGTASYLQEIVPPQACALGPANVHLLVPHSQAGELRTCAGLDIRTFADDAARAGRVPLLARAYLRAHAALRPDIVHVHGTYAGVAVRLAHRAAFHRSRLVYCSHGWAFDRAAPAWSRALAATVERVLAHATDGIVCISDHDRRSAVAHGLPAARLLTLRNAIGPPAVATDRVGWPGRGRRVLFVGRLDRQKGVDVLLDAMRIAGPRAQAIIVGSAVVEGQPLGELPANASIAGWVDRDGLQAYYASADLVVVPSRWEGFGLVALEAMRAGRAVVASDVGGLPELVVHGENGLLVPAGSPAALAQAILEPSDGQLVAMGEAGERRWREWFALDRLDAQLRALYERLASGQGLHPVPPDVGTTRSDRSRDPFEPPARALR